MKSFSEADELCNRTNSHRVQAAIRRRAEEERLAQRLSTM